MMILHILCHDHLHLHLLFRPDTDESKSFVQGTRGGSNVVDDAHSYLKESRSVIEHEQLFHEKCYIFLLINEPL